MSHKRNSEKKQGKKTVAKRASSTVIQSGECFLRAYQNFFGVLSASDSPNYPNFKSQVIEELDKNSPDSTIAVIVNQIKNSHEHLIREEGCFYQTNYALCTSKFFEKLQSQCCKQHMNAIRLDCIEKDTMHVFHSLNQKLLTKCTLFDSNNPYCTSNESLEKIKKWFLDLSVMKEMKSKNPDGKCVVLVDHLDNFFVSMFEEQVNNNKGFSLYDISQLRRFWIYAFCQLNIEGSIQCIASVLAPIDNELKTFASGLETNDHNVENKRRLARQEFVTRIISFWREKHCYIASQCLFDKIHSSTAGNFQCTKNDKPNCLFRARNTRKVGTNEDAQSILKDWACTIVTTLRNKNSKLNQSAFDPDGAYEHSLCSMVEHNPWLLCLSLYHSTRAGQNSSGEFNCSKLDENLKSHYRAERQKRKQRPLIKDYLQLLPLCIAGVIFYNQKKEKEDVVITVNTSPCAQKVAEKIEKSWGKTENQFYKNVIELIKFYSKFYKERYPHNNDPTKNWEKEVVIPKERSVKRRLAKHLPRVFKNRKYVTSLTDAIVWGDIFGRTPGNFDNKNGINTYKDYYARPFMHYLYSEAKTLQAVQETAQATSLDSINK